MGWSAGISGIAILFVGLWLEAIDTSDSGLSIFSGLLMIGGVLWFIAAWLFSGIKEHPGATEGGGNAVVVALRQLSLLQSELVFRRFVIARALLLSVALAPPFYVLVAQQNSDGLFGLGALIVANGLAASLSSPIWGYLGDRSAKKVMLIASIGAGVLGLLTFFADLFAWHWLISGWGIAGIFLVLNVMHGGVRLGRKVYLVDMANTENRAAYVAVSNTVIGVMMLVGGLFGLLGDWLGAATTIFVLSVLSMVAAVYIANLPEIEH